MKGFTRPVDELGRIVLPAEIRKENNIAANDRLYITVTDGGILLSKPKTACAACGNEEDLISVNEKVLCRCCIRTFSAVLDANNG